LSAIISASRPNLADAPIWDATAPTAELQEHWLERRAALGQLVHQRTGRRAEPPFAHDIGGLELTQALRQHVRADSAQTLAQQSMGGFTAPLACARLPVRQLVLLNAMIPRPGETPGEWWEATGQAEAKRANDIRDGRPPDADFDPRVDFFHDVPPDVVEEAFAQAPPRQSATPFGSTCDFISWPAVPTTVLAGRDDRFFPLGFQRRVAFERLGIVPEELPGGHLVALSQPVALAERLVRIARVTT
jgi:pimeloyl-ACP methyl ester carboxylesterase